MGLWGSQRVKCARARIQFHCMRSPIIFAPNLSYIYITYTQRNSLHGRKTTTKNEKKKNYEKNPQHRYNGNDGNWVCFLCYLCHCRCPLRLFQWLCIIFICIFCSQIFLLPSHRHPVARPQLLPCAGTRISKLGKIRYWANILSAALARISQQIRQYREQQQPQNARRVRRTNE